MVRSNVNVATQAQTAMTTAMKATTIHSAAWALRLFDSPEVFPLGNFGHLYLRIARSFRHVPTLVAGNGEEAAVRLQRRTSLAAEAHRRPRRSGIVSEQLEALFDVWSRCQWHSLFYELTGCGEAPVHTGCGRDQMVALGGSAHGQAIVHAVSMRRKVLRL